MLSNVPDIPAHRVIGPDDQIPQGVERGTVFLARTHGIYLWNLHKAMMLQMNRLKGVEEDQIEWTEYLPYPDVGLHPSKNVVMGQFMNDAIKIEMQNAQRHKKPGRKARMPPYQRQGYGHNIEPDRTQHNPEFLTILDPSMHCLQSSPGLRQKHTLYLVDTCLSRGSTRQKGMTTGLPHYVAQRKAKFPAFSEAPPPALPCVLKVENTLVVCALPHCGQGVGTTNCGRKVRRSNVVPHSSQVYSKIGILYSLAGLLSLSTAFLLVYPQVGRITRVNLEPAMQRMLVIRGGAVGDLIVTLPALGALRRAFPHATIELLGNPSRAILAQHPRYVNGVIDLERWDLYRLFSQQPSISQGLATFLSSFALILSYLPMPDVTFVTNLRRYCQGEILTWQPHPPPGMHITDHLLQPVTRCVRQPGNACPHVYLDPAAQEFAAHFWQTAGLPDQGVVAFHPGSGGASKLWPVAGWEQIMTWTAQQRLSGLIISGPAEQAPNAHLAHAAHLPPWPRVQNLPLPYLAALLARCQVVVGHDSGITHLAAAVGTTTLALFGPTDPLVWGPRSRRACVLWPEPPGPLTLAHLPPHRVTQTLVSLLCETLVFTPSQAACTILRFPSAAPCMA